MNINENNLKYYIVVNKADDYGNCVQELVHTTEKNAKEYYHNREVPEADVETLKKYFDFIDFEEENQRDDDKRFYGNE